MSFKKLLPIIKENLANNGIENPNAFQASILPKIKSGANLFGIGVKGCGKTSSIIISTIQKLDAKPFEDIPRAVIFVKDKQAALALEEKFTPFIKGTGLRIFSAFEEHQIMNQKDLIYDGVDIVIATPKRLSKLYFQCGVNLNQVKIVAIEDAEFLAHNLLSDLNRISNSLSKCQYVVLAEKMTPKLEKLQDSFMSNAQLIKG